MPETGLRADLIQRLRGRVPEVRHLNEEYEAAARHEQAEHEAKVAEAKAQAEREGKPFRPPKHEESQVPKLALPTIAVPVGRLLEVCGWLRDDADARLDYLSWVAGVDYPPDRIEVVYHLWSTVHNHTVVVKTDVPRSDPRVPSVTGLWLGADWHEREEYDLLGIVFEGHPNLRRIMMTDDWAGYPLRKDYTYEEPEWLVKLAGQRQQEVAATGQDWEGRGERS